MAKVHQNGVTEWKVPQGQVTVTAPDGSKVNLPSFQKGDGSYWVRYASSLVGIHKYQAGSESGEIEVTAYTGDNPLYKHGAVKAPNKKYLEHADGTPFFWLADTWWMGLTTRLPYPEGIAELAQDRVKKGFTAVQIVAGLFPDMGPFDPRGKNEVGFPWDENFTELNPAFFDVADKKIAYIVEQGLMPCIVGCWGYYVDFAGKEAMRKHWDHLVARWGAYPVMWCMAGEVFMPYYNNPGILDGTLSYEDYEAKVGADWIELTDHVRATDPFKRTITVHCPHHRNGGYDTGMHADVHMTGTTHSGPMGLVTNIVKVKEAIDVGALPLINSEVNYEGICGSSYADTQRHIFMVDMLTGCCGHTYGANGIWQLNTRKEAYGPSPHGSSWGDTPWEDAYQMPGSGQVGNAKRFMCKFDWWRFEPHPEWIEFPNDGKTLDGSFCVGIPGEVRFIFFPMFGKAAHDNNKIFKLDGSYHAYFYDMIQDQIHDLGMATPDADGTWKTPRVPLFQDWVVVLSKKPIA